jgi:hypothetical protein
MKQSVKARGKVKNKEKKNRDERKILSTIVWILAVLCEWKGGKNGLRPRIIVGVLVNLVKINCLNSLVNET